MRTLLLDRSSWDLVVDAAGNIAMASDPYSQAQDAASAIRTFAGEVYYDTTIGVPYWASVLGGSPSLSLAKAQFVAAVLVVPGVTSAQCFVSSVVGRTLSGQVQVKTSSGQSAVATF